MSVRKEMLEDMCIASNALAVGETLRINHTRCPAGEDTRRRFYVTRKPDVLLGYCHNCQQSVTKYVAPDDRYREGMSMTSLAIPVEIDPLTVSFSDKANIPKDATGWRMQQKLRIADCEKYDIEYVPEYNAILLPFYGFDDEDIGFQLRPLNTSRTAKYINHQKQTDRELGGVVVADRSTDTLIIVEDLVSAIHVNNAGYDALVNYGTHVKPTILYKASKLEHKIILVWLDNDNEHVLHQAGVMYRTLGMYDAHKHIRLVTGFADPKKYSDSEIKDVVDGHIRH